MNILTLIACVLLAVGGCFAAIGDYHMLQQNSYFISRYRKWLCGSLKKYVGRLAWVIVLLAASFNAILFLLACAAFAAWEVYISLAKQKKAIKPLVFTARVKRMMTTNALLLAAAGALSVFVSSYFLALMIALACFTPLTAVAVITINEPAEALVRRRFINDAKRILREHKPMTIIGVTGSFGKTSTKYALARILSEKYNVALTPGSFNTPLGVVRTVREKLKPADDVFIVEMGAKNVGDIREICDIVHPDECLITSVGPRPISPGEHGLPSGRSTSTPSAASRTSPGQSSSWQTPSPKRAAEFTSPPTARRPTKRPLQAGTSACDTAARLTATLLSAALSPTAAARLSPSRRGRERLRSKRACSVRSTFRISRAR